jgi:protein-S-isoprenylcysteine O-methyltransferase Ste14
MTDPQEDIAGVIVLPPFLYLGAVLAGGLLNLLAPRPLAASPVPLRWAGALLLVACIALVFRGARTLKGAGTTPDPMQPVTALVVAGPYRFSRNPMYLAMTVGYIGLALLLNSLWVGVMLAPLLIALHFGVIAREERYLDAKFGEQYRSYRARVRRWF